jgi:hypothetical protein
LLNLCFFWKMGVSSRRSIENCMVLHLFKSFCHNLWACDQGKGVARLWAKREARESHHMFPGVQRVQKVWGNEPSHSQVNSHCASWSPEWTPKSLKCDCRGRNPLPRNVLYTIGKLLKLICLKRACMTHLDI